MVCPAEFHLQIAVEIDVKTVGATEAQANAGGIRVGRDFKIVFEVAAGAVEDYIDAGIDLVTPQTLKRLHGAAIGGREIFGGYGIGRDGFEGGVAVGSQEAHRQGFIAQLEQGRVRGEG